MEGPDGVKWELGLAGLALGKWGSSHTATRIWSLGMGKNFKNQKWEWNLRIAKWDLEKNVLGNGIGTPPPPFQDPPYTPPIYFTINDYY